MSDKAGVKSEVENVLAAQEVAEATSLGLKDQAQQIDPAAERKVVRKCDLHLVPILFTLFLCAFIDR